MCNLYAYLPLIVNERMYVYRASIHICCAFMRMRMYEYVYSCICVCRAFMGICMYVVRSCVCMYVVRPYMYVVHLCV